MDNLLKGDTTNKSSPIMRLQKEGSAPLISVVIPAYNEELFIVPCLKSLKMQNFNGSFEVIVVDNNSSDNTADFARQHGAKVVFEARKGVCVARQAGTEAARGQIIISTDADTTFAPDWLQKVWDGFSNNPGVIAITSPVRFTDAPMWGKVYPAILFGSINALYKLTGKVWYISACNTAFRKNGWPGYNTHLTQAGDEFDFLTKLQHVGRLMFLQDNIVFTSSRRLRKGLLYNFFVTLLFYYILDYSVGRLFGKSLFGSYPAFRNNTARVGKGWSIARQTTIIILIFLTYSALTHSVLTHSIFKNAGDKINSISNKTPWQR